MSVSTNRGSSAAPTAPPLVAARTTLDRLLGRVTMYRLVVLGLAALVVLSFVLSLTGAIFYTPAALALTLAVLVVVTLASGRLYGALFGVTPHTESALVTAGLLYFLLWPSTEPLKLLAIALAAFAASASKYLVAWRGRHILNPAAAGVLLVTLLGLTGGVWWVATEPLLYLVAPLVLLIAYRTGKLPVVALFIVVAGALTVVFSMSGGTDLAGALQYAFVASPIVFLGGFMLTEPLTLPPTRGQQLAVAALVGVLVALPTLVSLHVGLLSLTPETALLVGNVVAFALARRRGLSLTLSGRRSFGPTTTEFVFTPDHPVRYRPGQWLELTLPHRKVDSRGSRRVFSIASATPDGSSVAVGIKLPPGHTSSFKRALGDLPVGTHLRATTVAGEFTLPTDRSQPLLLVAGGIGITPYLTQLAECVQQGRDVVLAYGVTDPDEIPYRDDLVDLGVPVVLAAPRVASVDLPDGWVPVEGFLTADTLREHVPDVDRRVAYVSGPPVMVNALSATLRQLGARKVRTDAFVGY
ncbi:FAD-dependent oxidoreductase [Nakamurella flava]|uniref:FAD-dependent oxidoreductase n=1 Tax=Nakamurella flava TaxID=2576308 RepID=A0A4U6QLW1_9ACTN|nr:FAD-dependent oxidoreductase [Nakamurella flava]TKV61554.1 FAD-dependent oxidoreductase [Nakamurella flava]